jgi:hypothetical protein
VLKVQGLSILDCGLRIEKDSVSYVAAHLRNQGARSHIVNMKNPQSSAAIIESLNFF